MAIELSYSNLVNTIAFVGLTVATYTVFYFGKTLAKSRGVSFSLFTLALGLNLIGLSYLFRVWVELVTSPLVLATVALGSVFLSIGVVWVFYEKNTEMAGLKRREEDIKSVIAKLKERYYQQELSEADLKTAYSELLKELAEIEVKMADEYQKGKTNPPSPQPLS
ncbi:MAG: hypothetical protein HYT70_04015 [Candidatus Aenigmarchaeota archaeon]|nr:hypothetical protein [Candidatus Aenigmarchaeota archaeon]